jgi:hypothetical protein
MHANLITSITKRISRRDVSEGGKGMLEIKAEYTHETIKVIVS